jgi:methyl-accepting chemotaxis protein WspA
MLHYHPTHRARQLRWVLPAVALLFLATLITLGLVYQSSNQAVGTEFWHAHIQISRTGQLLQRGMAIGVVVLTVLLFAIAAWAISVAHRVVRPVHTLHRALDELVTGDLAVRLELHRRDEFQEVAAALNRLVDEFSTTLKRVHDLVDQIEALAEQVAHEAQDQSAEAQLHRLARELNQTMEFFSTDPERVIREGEV